MSELGDADLALVRDLINNSALDGIEFHEISAQRYDGASIGDANQNGDVEFSFQRRADQESFGIRAHASLHLAFGEATVTVAATYRILNGETPTERQVELFANEVAIMAMFPYVREGLASATARVFGVPVMLPTAERGQLGFEVE
ncbi:hypothetical protein ACXR2T_09030 [Leucobacter sp. HY1910]